MSEHIDEEISRYCCHFTKQIKLIKALSGESASLFQKALFCSLLDALSRSAITCKNNKERFTYLVEEFGQWSNQDRVSLPHLARVLQIAPDPAFSELREYSTDKLSAWKATWGSIKLDQDPKLDEVLKHCPNKDPSAEINGVQIKFLTHLHLLYSHRNSLIHELRSPGKGMESEEEHEPFYHDLSTITSFSEPSIETIELVYPVLFFEQMCTTVLTGLKEYLKANELNPFDCYDFGSYWLDKLK